MIKVRMVALWSGCLLALLGVVGCGSGYAGPKLYALSGRVTVNGQAPGGNFKVMLVHTDPNTMGPSLIIQEDGSYQASTAHGGKGLPGAAAGKYKVVLEALTSGESMYGPGGAGGAPGAGGMSMPGGAGSGGAIPGMAKLPQDLAAYASAETSPKEVEVATSKNSIDIVIP